MGKLKFFYLLNKSDMRVFLSFSDKKKQQKKNIEKQHHHESFRKRIFFIEWKFHEGSSQ